MIRVAKSLRSAGAASYSVVLVCLLWEAVAAGGFIRPVFLPRMTEVLRQLTLLVGDGSLIGPSLVSLGRAAAGLGLSIAIGAPLGFLAARSRAMSILISPLLSIGQTLPKVALIPILILWLGIGSTSKIALVFLTCLFPIAIAVEAAASAVPKVLLWSARSLGATEPDVVRSVLLPASLSGLMSGLRVALPLALLATFTAEMVGGGGGLGSALMYSQRLFDTPTVYAYLLIMMLIGIVFDLLFLRARARLLRWDEHS